MAIARELPTANASGTSVATPTRTGRYSEAYALPMSSKELFFADEGSHYVAVNATPGTGIIGPVSTTLDETKPLLVLFNGNTASSGICLYPQSILLDVSVVGVGHTRDQFTFAIDNINRVTSGGTALTKANLNMNSGLTSAAVVTFGAITSPTQSASRRLLGNYVVKGANIEVVWDQFEFIFGAPGGSTGGLLTPTTVATQFTRYVPPVVIGPGQSFVVHQWAASISTGITFEPVINYVER